MSPSRLRSRRILATAVSATRSLNDETIAAHLRTTFDTVIGPITFGQDGEWTAPRIICIQFQGISGNDFDQFKDWTRQVVVYPREYKAEIWSTHSRKLHSSWKAEKKPVMKLGFVGLGAMGQLIVPRLMAAGHEVTGWNRSKGKAEALIKSGMHWADTPRAVAEQSELVFSIVTDAKAVRAVALGRDGIVAGLRKRGIYIDMSTIEPDESRAVAAEFVKAGSIMLDGPISGSPVTVTQGNASIMIGGDERAFEYAKPVLLAIGPKVTRIGVNGLACQMKIAVNLLLMVEVVAFGEAVALAEKGGVARDVALDAILKSVAASPVLGYRGPFILEGKMPTVPLADVTLQQKDMMLALNLGRTMGSPMPLAAAANEIMNACRGMGLDGNDFVVAHQVYRRLGGQA